MKKFKVLLVYPNLTCVSLMPSSVALLSAYLKLAGNEVKLFDTTYYKMTGKTNDEMRVDRMHVRKFNIEDVGVKIKQSNVYEDFIKMVKEYKPNLIGVSVVDDTVELGLNLIKKVDCNNICVVFGGINATFNSEELIKERVVDIL